MERIFKFDEKKARGVERMYALPDIVAQRRSFIKKLELKSGESILDVGAGPGYLLAEMANITGVNGHITGIDLSPDMVAIAQNRCKELPQVTVQEGDATNLPCADEIFDVLVSTQVYEYVADMPGALCEAYRVLKPGGRIAILDTDWQSVVWHNSDPARMTRVMKAWDAHLFDPNLPQTLLPKLRAAGFSLQSCDILPILNPEYDPQTYSGTMLRNIAGFTANIEEIGKEVATAWREDLLSHGSAGTYFFSLNRYVFIAQKPV
ncbi:MAG: methyltransferase domain-containing protein [Pseudomonadota bacterium]